MMSMTLGLTLLVRDEIDIVDAFLDYHLPKVDFMIVTDNLSKDGTYERLVERAKQDPKIHMIVEKAHTFRQSLWVTRMAHLAADKGADWVLHSDVDEFWIGDLRKLAAEAPPTRNAFVVNKYDFHPCFRDDAEEENPVKRLLYRRTDITEAGKVFHETRGFRSVCYGNHHVVFNAGAGQDLAVPEDVWIAHYPVRSWKQYMRKTRQGGQAYARGPYRKVRYLGKHWRDRYDTLAKGGIFGLRREYAENHLADTEEKAQALGLIEDRTVADDPIFQSGD